MNKKKIDEYIPTAYEALLNSELVKDNKMPKTYRGYISSFGASIAMGSIRSAVFYYYKDDTKKELMKIIFDVIKKDKDLKNEDLKDYVCKTDEKEAKENIYNATIAIKLAMNMFEFISDKEEGV